MTQSISLSGHVCQARPTSHPLRSFCARCGIYMPKTSPNVKYHRSRKYSTIEPFKIDADVLFDQLAANQHWSRMYNRRACHLALRDEMLSFIDEAACKLTYSESTHHLAVTLLDSLMSLYDVESRMLKLFGFMSLYLAAKLHEKAEALPSFTGIVKMFNDVYALEEVRECESMFVKALHYRLDAKTPYTFIDYFFTRGVLSDDDVSHFTGDKQTKIALFEALVVRIGKAALHNYYFFRYKPLTIAAAALACARKIFGVPQLWNDDLKCLTRTSWRHIHVCASELLKIALQDDPHIMEKYKRLNRARTEPEACGSRTLSNSQTTCTEIGSEREIGSLQSMPIEHADEKCVASGTQRDGFEEEIEA